MDCISCEREAGYNRAVVDVFNGIEIGGLCVGCEREEFGKTLARRRADEEGNCLLCNRDGQYALALWRPTQRESGGDIHCSVEYDVTDRTLLLCDEHLHEIRTDDRVPARAKPPVTDSRR